MRARPTKVQVDGTDEVSGTHTGQARLEQRPGLLGPALHRQLFAAGPIALGLRLSGVLGDGASVRPEAPGQPRSPSAGAPVHKDLNDVGHFFVASS